MRQKKGIAAGTAVRLDFDGEPLDPESTVDDAELEDEDMLDLHVS